MAASMYFASEPLWARMPLISSLRLFSNIPAAAQLLHLLMACRELSTVEAVGDPSDAGHIYLREIPRK
jgi:hypothetical protein